MKKIILGLTLVFTAFLLVACNGKREEPTLEVPMELSVKVGVKVDIKDEITALDQDGKDISDSLVITSDDSSVVIDGKSITVNEIGSVVIKVTVSDSVDKDLTISKSIFVDALANDTVVSGKVLNYTFDKVSDEALNGFKVKEGEEDKELSIKNGELIYVNNNKGAVISKELELDKDSSYKIVLKMRASKNLNNVTLSIVNEESTFGITEELKDYEVVVNSEEDINAVLNLEIKDHSDYTLYIERLFVEISSGIEESTLDLNKFNYINEDGDSSYSVLDNKGTIKTIESAGGIWQQKLIKGGIELTPNKKYILSYTITATEDIRYEFIARVLDQQANGRDENYVWSAPTVNKGETKVIKHVFETNEEDIFDFEMFFQIGNQGKANEITISNVELDYYNVFEEEITRFTGVTGFESFEGDDAEASLYLDLDVNALVYDVSKFGTVDWYNKVFIEDVLFEEDSRYKVEMKLRADKEVEFFFAVNPMGQWEPKITDVIRLSTTYQTFTYETDSFQTFNQNFELLFQFGAMNEGSAQIFFESIVITQLVRG